CVHGKCELVREARVRPGAQLLSNHPGSRRCERPGGAPTVPARRLRELLALAKARPRELPYGSSGNGTTPHLSGELLKSMASIDIMHVPYRGASAALADLMGGHVDMAFTSLSAVIGPLEAGKLRALAVTSAKRSPLMPDLP